MTTICTRCNNTGFLNLEQLYDLGYGLVDMDNLTQVLATIKELDERNKIHDISVCDCCGDGEGWYGTPGEHYNSEDPPGPNGPYAYNGGLCECH